MSLTGDSLNSSPQAVRIKPCKDQRFKVFYVNFSFQSVILLSTVITRETFGHQRFAIARAHAHKSRIHADIIWVTLVIIHSRTCYPRRAFNQGLTNNIAGMDDE